MLSTPIFDSAHIWGWWADGRRGGHSSRTGLFLLLPVFVVISARLARRVKGSYPILLVIAGILVSFVPGVPRIGLEPDLVFAVYLPPLQYSAAWTLSWRKFQRHFARIAMLAIGLVPFIVVGLAMRSCARCNESSI
jgi:NhaP-type Na+/H+ or K+/H+ antiporter